MMIDWEQTVRTKTSDELFPDEDITKGTKWIHAWNFTDADYFIKTIINN